MRECGQHATPFTWPHRWEYPSRISWPSSTEEEREEAGVMQPRDALPSSSSPTADHHVTRAYRIDRGHPRAHHQDEKRQLANIKPFKATALQTRKMTRGSFYLLWE
ncbi:hypothetical protein TRVL_07113 [Trypanosoma vivax]|nr:hypothetical protein TRVL_07113 [Trypanosoma vivax]